MNTFTYLIIFIGVALTQSSLAQKTKFQDQIALDVEKYQLSNGLTVILHEDHSAPTISLHQWFRVGSVNEEPHRTGLAHFFEHMMFRGTEKIPGDVFDKRLERMGASNNAFTSRDYTGYYENFPSKGGKNLESVIQLESDRMLNLALTKENVQQEKGVVQDERLRSENNVNGVLFESLLQNTFKGHNYSWPVLGYTKHIAATTKEEFYTFYKKYYQPNNAVLVIAGDFKISVAKKLIKKHYERLPTTPLNLPNVQPLPVQNKPRTQEIYKDVQRITFAMAYPSIPAAHEDEYPLDLMVAILGEGDSSRLNKALVEDAQLATGIYMGHYTLKESGTLNVMVPMQLKQSSTKALKIIQSEFDKIKSSLVSERELQKAKNQVVKNTVDQLRTISNKAETLAMWETLFKDHNGLSKTIDKYLTVTREDIQRVAQKYIIDNKLSLTKVLPESQRNSQAQKKPSKQ